MLPAPPKRTTAPKLVSITENHWQVAFNNKVAKGKLEVVLPSGRADIVNDQYAIEVDKVSKYKEGVEQALRYAKDTGKLPGLALYIDGQPDGATLLHKASVLCAEKGVRWWYINEHVSVNDLISLTETTPYVQKQTKKTGATYWINTSSGTRHNKACRYYGNTKSGRYTSSVEGKACGTCGG